MLLHYTELLLKVVHVRNLLMPLTSAQIKNDTRNFVSKTCQTKCC